MNRAKRKGDDFERWVVNTLKDEGVEAQRTLLPAQAGKQDPGDIFIAGLKAECKVRKTGTGFKLLYQWLGENDFIITKQDRKQPLVTMEWNTFLFLMKGKS